MIRYAMLYVSTLVLFVAIDMVWLGYVAKQLYAESLGPILAEKVNLPAALVFYLLYPAGLILFAITRGLDAEDWRVALLWGALYGFFAYMTYDLTNLATLRSFPVKIAAVDMAWGTVLSGVVAALIVIGARALSGRAS